MKRNENESVKYCLRGHKTHLLLKLIVKRICDVFLVIYCFTAFYLLVFDTSLISGINLYNNEYIAVSLCFSVVLIGFVLLLFDRWQKYKFETSVYSLIDDVQIRKMTFESLIKYLILNFTVNLIKFLYFTASVLPSVFLTAVGYVFLKNGIPTAVFFIYIVCDLILLFNGLINSFCMIQKFSLVNYCFSEYKNESVIKLIKISSYITDGKCNELAKYKIKHCIFKFIGLVIPSLMVREIASEFFIVTDKIIPHMHTCAHTEKSVVFYLGNATAG